MSRISSLALHRKSRKSAAPAASAPGECSSAGMIRSDSRCSVEYSCAVSAFGLYGAPFAADFCSATLSCTCCASACAMIAAPAATFANRSRLVNSKRLDIALPHLLGEILRPPPRKSHDAQRHVLVRLTDHRRRVAYEQVFHVVRLAVAVQHRRLRVLAHLYRAGLVDNRASRRDRPFRPLPPPHHRPAHGLDNRRERVLHVLHLLDLVLRPFEVEPQHRNSPRVRLRGVDFAPRVLIRDHLAAAREVHECAVLLPQLLLQRLPVPLVARALSGKRPELRQREPASELDVIPAREVLLLVVVQPPRDVQMHAADAVAVVPRHTRERRNEARHAETR